MKEGDVKTIVLGKLFQDEGTIGAYNAANAGLELKLWEDLMIGKQELVFKAQDIAFALNVDISKQEVASWLTVGDIVNTIMKYPTKVQKELELIPGLKDNAANGDFEVRGSENSTDFEITPIGSWPSPAYVGIQKT
ncbi:MAG: hypothetical protein WCK37_02910 [Candidatus Falkowbacteria bacterium]